MEGDAESPPPPPPGTSAAGSPPPLPNLVEIVQAKDKAEKAAKKRNALLQLITEDYKRLLMDEEDAKEAAEKALDRFAARKEPHSIAMGAVKGAADEAKGRLQEADDHLSSLVPQVAALGDQATPSVKGVREARLVASKIKSILERSWPELSEELSARQKAAEAVFYRPDPAKEPGKAVVAHVRTFHTDIAAQFDATNNELEEIARTKLIPSSTPPLAAGAVPPKKMFARDFDIKKWVGSIFSGDKDTALSDYDKWKKGWDHALGQVKEQCIEVGPASILHLIREVLEGTAAKVTASAMDVEAVHRILEDKFGDVVALMETYLPQPYPHDNKSPGELAAEALAFADRWPTIRENLEENEIDFDCFNGVRIQLAAFGPAAKRKWRASVKAAMREKPEGTKMGEAYNWTAFKKWLQKVSDEIEAKEEPGDEATSAGLFAATSADIVLTTGGNSSLIKGCLVCGPTVSHSSAVCRKIAAMEPEAYFAICTEKKACKRCAQATWSGAHAKVCDTKCGTCGKGHLSTRHKKAANPGKRSYPEPSRKDSKRSRVEASREPATSPQPGDSNFQAAVEKALEVREARMAPPAAPAQVPSRGNYRGYRGRGGRGKGARGRGKSAPSKEDASK